MIDLTLARYLADGLSLVELDLGHDLDAVTHAMPRYPAQQPKPPHPGGD